MNNVEIKIKEGFVLRQVAGEYMVVPVGETNGTFYGMIRLNKVGAFLWEKCSERTTKKEVLDAVLEHYEVETEQAEKKMWKYFSDKLKNAGLLEA